MNVYGELTRAQLENLTADPSLATATEGRIWMRTDTSPVAVKVDLGGSVDTFCLLAATQTLTNKTISGATGITSVGTIATGVWQGTTVATGFGGTGVTSVTTTPAASAFAGWDANKNLSANNFLPGYRTTVTSAGTLTLVLGDACLQYLTGSTTHIVVLPVTSTLTSLGFPFVIVNNSTGVVTVKSSGGNTIRAMAASTVLSVNCILLSGTDATSWNALYAGATGSILTAPTVQSFTSTGTQTGWVFTISAGNATVGSTWTNNSNTYTCLGTISSGTTLFCSGTGATSGGTLTKATGSGDATLTFSSKVASATYTTPVGALYLRARVLGGGGGGSAVTTNSGGNATASLFGANLLSAGGGGGGAASAGAGGSGGTSSLGSAVGIALTGGTGQGGMGNTTSTVQPMGGYGAPSPFGGAGGGGNNGNAGVAAAANTGSGGGGAAGNSSTTGGSGGGAGGFIDAIITVPAGTYPYAVGTKGSGGSAGTVAGGNGADGIIEITEFYQ